MLVGLLASTRSQLLAVRLAQPQAHKCFPARRAPPWTERVTDGAYLARRHLHARLATERAVGMPTGRPADPARRATTRSASRSRSHQCSRPPLPASVYRGGQPSSTLSVRAVPSAPVRARALLVSAASSNSTPSGSFPRRISIGRAIAPCRVEGRVRVARVLTRRRPLRLPRHSSPPGPSALRQDRTRPSHHRSAS